MRNPSLRATNCLSHYMAVLEADMSTDDINLSAQYAFSSLKLIVTIHYVCPFLVVVFTYRIAHFPMSSNKIILLWYVLVFLINTVTYIWHLCTLYSLPVTFLDHVFYYSINYSCSNFADSLVFSTTKASNLTLTVTVSSIYDPSILKLSKYSDSGISNE